MKDQRIASGQSFSDLSSFVTFRIARVQNSLNAQAISTLAAHSDLKLTEWRLLASVESLGSTNAAEIVRRTQIDKGQVSRGIKSLRAKGMLSVTGSETDHRQQTLSLSATGLEEFEKVVAVMRQRQEVLTQDITQEELEVLFSVLDRLETRARDTVQKN